MQELGSDEGALATIRTAVELGQAYGLTVAAVGVETALQLDLLRGTGCTVAQGFYLGRPRPASDFLQSLDEGIPATAPMPGLA